MPNLELRTFLRLTLNVAIFVRFRLMNTTMFFTYINIHTCGIT